MEQIISLQNIAKKFKDKKAVDDISFSIKKGEIVAILGPNGAGKSTTMLMMLGLLEPTSGSINIFNRNPKEKQVRERIGAMLQEVSVIDALKVKEVIQLFRSYYPNPMEFAELVTLTGLNDEDLKRKADKLSGGQKRRLGFALALAGNPDVLFFDEPTVGMDISSRKRFWDTIQALKERGKTIIFSTHYLQEADDIAERILLFNEGVIVADGTPKEIKKQLSKQSVSFIDPGNLSLEELQSLPIVRDVYRKNNRVYVVTEQTDDVLEYLFSTKEKVQGIQIEQGRLDEAFAELTENKEAI
ncbi:ABC transporter ATP-binding protein [Robertmurraya andreesenii]|uniref:ABC-2 type transport system ATP-binding protein n=1 Tax=Anoxybacillus andreesenii TaxID=1325932 RepID=A0ABT9V5H6_9BACL|nr:ABC transporter ATP-binding protein [Robertmurraya andreesenii]MDQ0156202.1 ABC-2 type transport system ATP-binding protein [Robertmurraya andreesenii]